MKAPQMKPILTILLLASFGALFSQVPDGGTMLNSESGTTYQSFGNSTLTEVAVTGQPFTQALRVAVGSNVSNAWDAQLKFPAAAGIEENDVVLVAFYARTVSSIQETGEGEVTVCIEENVSYAKELYYKISIGQEWKEYYAPVQITNTLDASSVSYLFHIGYPSQTIEVAMVRFLNYKNTRTLAEMPITEITYIGQAPDASWRAPAEERINQIRKGRADLVVYDAQGQPVQGAEISIEMVSHQFGFGTAIAAGTFNSNATYREKVLELFNEVVFENDLKWPQFDPNSSNNALNLAFDTLEAHQIGVRGHNVIWPSFRNCPSSLEALRDNPVALKNAIDKRIDDVTGFTSGRLIDWDVINEPYSEHDLMDILGDEAMADWFKRVRRSDRRAKLYLNDYSILSAGGINKNHQDYYYNVIRYIDSLGGGIEGIGLQGHFGSELTPIARVYEILERYAALGKEMKITEHDIDLVQRGVQADYTRDFMTILFSHPSVKSLLVWGFWEGRHWRPEAAFFSEDWSIRPHGQVWQEMIFNRWWTPAIDELSGDQGEAAFEGFLGTYAYTVSAGGMERKGTFTLDHSFQSGESNQIVISLDPSVPNEAVIVPSRPGFLCQGEQVTLQAPEGTGLEYAWYRNDTLLNDQSSGLLTGMAGSYSVKVTKSGLELFSAPYVLEVRAMPESSIALSGNPALCMGEGITLSTDPAVGIQYEWMDGTVRIQEQVTSIEVFEPGHYTLVASSNGCEALSGTVEVTVGPLYDIPIEALGDLSICEGEEVVLRTVPEPGKIYTWRNGDSIVEADNFRIHASTGGAYRVSSITGGCQSISEPLNVQVLPLPEAVITYTGDLSLCPGTTLTLEANTGAGLAYAWLKGETALETVDPFLEVGEGGSYTLLTGNAGCTATSEPVVVSLLSPEDALCTTGIDMNPVGARIFPNPFKGSFQLELDSPSLAGTRLEIFDAMGRLVVINEVVPGTSLVHVALADQGMFLARLYRGREFYTFKLIAE